MRKLLHVILTVFPLCFQTLTAAGETPVMMMLRSDEQRPEHGCNFVERVCEIVYDAVLSKQVKLWDSPEKELQIHPSALKEIEKNSPLSFTDLETIFFYEMWEQKRKEVITNTVGISFTNRTEDPSRSVTFGYVDYDDLDQLFLKNKIETNANGIYSSTFKSYILSHNYSFNLVQFNGVLVKSPSESAEIVKSFTRELPFNRSILGYYPPDKYVSLIMDTYSESEDSTSYFSKNFDSAMERYFRDNKEVFFNLGGDKIFDHIEQEKLKVTRVQLNEIWRIIGNELNFDTQGLVVFVNDEPMDEIPFNELRDMEITVAGHNISDLIDERRFNFIITRINAQEIRNQDSYLYQKALLSGNWDNVIEYVLNF